MKPKNKKNFCTDCGMTKMLEYTQSKANKTILRASKYIDDELIQTLYKTQYKV